jgi:hypothetical protein
MIIFNHRYIERERKKEWEEEEENYHESNAFGPTFDFNFQE